MEDLHDKIKDLDLLESESDRHNGLRYAIKNCMKKGTTEAYFLQILSDIRNELAIEPEDS